MTLQTFKKLLTLFIKFCKTWSKAVAEAMNFTRKKIECFQNYSNELLNFIITIKYVFSIIKYFFIYVTSKNSMTIYCLLT